MARSSQRPDRTVTAHRSQRVDPTMQPEPARVTQLTWTLGRRARPKPLLRLRLTNIASLSVLLHDAGFHRGQHATLRVTTDGRTVIRLGSQRLRVAKGSHVLHFVA